MDCSENWFGQGYGYENKCAYIDRFIPYRPDLNVDNAHMQIFSGSVTGKNVEGGLASPGLAEYSRRLSLVLNEQQNILPTHAGQGTKHRSCSPPNRSSPQRKSPVPWLMELGEEVTSPPPSVRHVSPTPDRVLDMPGLRDDFYCNLLDWGSNGCIAVALGANAYVWNVNNQECQRLRLHLSEQDFYISSVGWSKVGDTLAIGTCQGDLLLWDANCGKLIKHFSSRDHCHIGSLSWSQDHLFTGSRKGRISVYDPRDASQTCCMIGHKRDVTNLKLSGDEELLASGGDDGVVNIWNMRSRSVHRRIDAHKACAKALAWCPWRPSVIASGGGTNDGHIRLWHVHTGERLAEVDTKSQVCSLLWSPVYHELVSSHGVPHAERNNVQLWQSRLLKLEQTTRLRQHTRRPLHLAISPDGTTLASLGADENLCLWMCFQSPKPKSSTSGCRSPLQLHKSIR